MFTVLSQISDYRSRSLSVCLSTSLFLYLFQSSSHPSFLCLFPSSSSLPFPPLSLQYFSISITQITHLLSLHFLFHTFCDFLYSINYYPFPRPFLSFHNLKKRKKKHTYREKSEQAPLTERERVRSVHTAPGTDTGLDKPSPGTDRARRIIPKHQPRQPLFFI